MFKTKACDDDSQTDGGWLFEPQRKIKEEAACKPLMHRQVKKQIVTPPIYGGTYDITLKTSARVYFSPRRYHESLCFGCNYQMNMARYCYGASCHVGFKEPRDDE